LNKVIGLAYLPASRTVAGSKFQIRIDGGCLVGSRVVRRRSTIPTTSDRRCERATSQLVILDLSGQPRLGFKGRGTLAAMQKRGIVVEKQPNRAFPQTRRARLCASDRLAQPSPQLRHAAGWQRFVASRGRLAH